ncbi:MAG: putative porin, partial [Cellulophaga sp.]|nr:putative porin [Cellulophaga sp.]
MRYIILIILLLNFNLFFAQEDEIINTKQSDSLNVKKIDLPKGNEGIKTPENGKMPITSYKIISFNRDTTYVDTTLSIQKEYKYNYLRKDDFELLPFANMGRPYNSLGLDFESSFFYPKLGASARHANFAELEDVNYYHVPTPMTEAMF